MLRQIGRFSRSAREFTKPRIPPDKQLAYLINLSITNLAQSNTSKGIGNPEKQRFAVPASAQDISASGLKYLSSITAAGNKYRFSTLRALTFQTNDITLSYATSPYSALHNTISFSIDQKTLYATRDLSYLKSAISSVLCRKVISTILNVSFPKDNVFTRCLACKVKSW